MKDGDFGYRIPAELIAKENRDRADDIDRDYEGLRESLRRAGVLSRLGVDLDQITEQVSKFEAAIPTGSLAAGGDGAGRAPVPGAPANIFELLVDARTVHSLSGATPRVSLHFPAERVDDPMELREYARRLEIGFGTLCAGADQDRPGERSPGPGIDAISHFHPAVRAEGVERLRSAIEFGKAVGAEDLSIGIGDGGLVPGEVHFRRSLDRTIDSLKEAIRALPEGWRLLLSSRPPGEVRPRGAPLDWGTTYAAATALGERAFCLIDLGGSPSASRAEMAVGQLILLGKLGGLHLADPGPAGGALAAGSIHPHRLFLVFCELVDAEGDPEVGKDLFRPSFTVGGMAQSRDPIENLLQAMEAILQAYARSLLVDRAALTKVQDRNDVVSAEALLKRAYETDVRPILRRARVQKGAAADPLEVYRSARYREEKARERRAHLPGPRGRN